MRPMPDSKSVGIPFVSNTATFFRVLIFSYFKGAKRRRDSCLYEGEIIGQQANGRTGRKTGKTIGSP